MISEEEFGLLDAESGERVALRGVDVSARISGLLAETRLTQRYRNETSTNLELIYTFPLPVSGVLLSFSVTIGDRQYHGEVIPRSKAEVDYEKAIGKGDSAFRLQELEAGIYNATLGNVMAGEAVEISLSYAETLAWNGKSLRYRLPTTLAPRYGEPKGMQPWQRPETDLLAEYPLSLQISIAGALAKSAIACPSHKISLKAEQDELFIFLANGASMDRDFILEIQNDDVSSIGVLASARDTNIAMLTLLPPEQESIPNHRDVVLVIDCSGSMQGDSLHLAREGVELALGSLEPDDRFGLIGFGTEFRHFDMALQPANRKNLDMARRWLRYLDNLGGTNIDGALELALRLHDGKGMDILLLTDGQDWRKGDAILKAKQKGVRIFSMGIGSAVAEDAVRRMADETGGACELIAPTEDMSERIYRHFKRMRQPQMSRLEIAWPTPPCWEQRPDRACFAGDAYTVFAALPTTGADEVTVAFEFANQESQNIQVPLLPETASADAIVRVAAKAHLAALPEREQMNWAMQHQLISKQTDYLITVERSTEEKAMALPELQIQPQMLPAGWGGSSSVVKNYNRPSPGVYFRRLHGSYGGASFSESNDGMHISARVCRARSTPGQKPIDNSYRGFIKQLQEHANRMGGGFPGTYRGIRRVFALPEKLAELLKLLHDNCNHQELVGAFYLALFKHDGQHQLNAEFFRKAQKSIGKVPPRQEIVTKLVNCLNQLYQLSQASEG